MPRNGNRAHVKASFGLACPEIAWGIIRGALARTYTQEPDTTSGGGSISAGGVVKSDNRDAVKLWTVDEVAMWAHVGIFNSTHTPLARFCPRLQSGRSRSQTCFLMGLLTDARSLRLTGPRALY